MTTYSFFEGHIHTYVHTTSIDVCVLVQLGTYHMCFIGPGTVPEVINNQEWRSACAYHLAMYLYSSAIPAIHHHDHN